MAKDLVNYPSFCTFALMNNIQWSENVIIADAALVDRVAFDLIVNFERMLERRIPQADMAKWVECIALDSGLRNGEHQTTVILTHDKEMTEYADRIVTLLDGETVSNVKNTVSKEIDEN